MAFRDIVIDCGADTKESIYWYWFNPRLKPENWSQGEPIFVSIGNVPAADGRPNANEFAAHANRLAQGAGGSFIRAMCKKAASSSSWKRGDVIGRIAIVGYEHGVGALEWVVSNDPLADKVDCFCAFEHFHNPEVWRELIRYSASGDGPLVVVTSSQRHDPFESSDSWQEIERIAAKGLGEVSDTYKLVGAKKASVRPLALFGIAEPPYSYPPHSSGLNPQGRQFYKLRNDGEFLGDKWPVVTSYADGNFVAIVFAGDSMEAEQFQRDWVQPCVFADLIIPRWAVECSQGSERASASPFVVGRRITRDRRQAHSVMARGLPSLSGNEECVVYGKFATDILSQQDLDALSYGYVAKFVLPIVAISIIWYIGKKT